MASNLHGDDLQKAYNKVLADLMALRQPGGWWEGELSTSALSTAVACSALRLCGRTALVDRGIVWLAGNQNPDGGWGDTVASKSNLSTTLLAVAAFHITERAGGFAETLLRARDWIVARAGQTPAQWAEAVRASYGKGIAPRTVNLITGPSRSGDIEQQIVLGAHGPRRLHIIILRD